MSAIQTAASSPARRTALLAVMCAASLAIVLHRQLLTGFAWTFGEDYDATIEVVLLEHWYRVVRGFAVWNAPGYFHPYSDTLGYNDGFVLSGLIYAPFRAIGCDPFLANTMTFIVWKVVGFAGMIGLLRRTLRCPWWTSALGGMLFVVSDNLLMQTVHGQLLTINLTPSLAALLIGFVRAVIAQDRRAALRTGCAFGALYASAAMNGFYTAWFFGYFTLATASALLVVGGGEGRLALLRGTMALRRTIAVVAVVIALCLVPLLLVYLPQFAHGNAHGYVEALDEMPRPGAILNVGAGNLLWGHATQALLRRLGGGEAPGGEQIAGFPPVLLLVAAASVVALLRRRDDRLLLAVAIAGAATWLTIVRVGDHSLWRIPFTVVPGAAALRALARYQLFLALPVIALAMVGLSRLRAPAGLLAALAALLVVEEINLQPPIGVDRHAQLARVAALPPLPRSCRAFFVAGTAPAFAHQPWEWAYIDEAEDVEVPGQIDAMLLAALSGVPTINGYATFGPPDGLSGNTAATDFLPAVRDYVRRHRLTHVCGYDRRLGHRWFERPFG